MLPLPLLPDPGCRQCARRCRRWCRRRLQMCKWRCFNKRGCPAQCGSPTLCLLQAQSDGRRQLKAPILSGLPCSTTRSTCCLVPLHLVRGASAERQHCLLQLQPHSLCRQGREGEGACSRRAAGPPPRCRRCSAPTKRMAALHSGPAAGVTFAPCASLAWPACLCRWECDEKLLVFRYRQRLGWVGFALQDAAARMLWSKAGAGGAAANASCRRIKRSIKRRCSRCWEHQHAVPCRL